MQSSAPVDALQEAQRYVRDSRNRTDGAQRSTTVTRNRLTRFVFTLNNWTDEELEAIKSITNVKWLIVGKERGENGTNHLQGACVIGRQVAFSTVKKLPGMNRAHIEIMRGSPAQSKVYCSKEDQDPYEFGTMPEPGKRNDLHETIALITQGQTLKDICADAENIANIACIVRYNKGLSYIKSLMTPNRTEAPIVFWLYGPTEIGKTRSAVEFSRMATGTEPWISPGSLKWFDGYDGDRAVIFDDLRTKHVEFSMLLRLLDRYPIRVEFKGGFTNWIPHFITVTAPYAPDEMWNLRKDEDLKQLARRVTYPIDCSEYTDYESILTAMLTAYNNDHPDSRIDGKFAEQTTTTNRQEQNTIIDLTNANSTSGSSDGRDSIRPELERTIEYSSEGMSIESASKQGVSTGNTVNACRPPRLAMEQCGSSSDSGIGPGGYMSCTCTTTESYESDGEDPDKCKDIPECGNSGAEAIDSGEESIEQKYSPYPLGDTLDRRISLSESLKLIDSQESYARYNTDYETKRREVNTPRYEEVETLECDEAIGSDEWKSYLEDRVCGHTPDNHNKTKFF